MMLSLMVTLCFASLSDVPGFTKIEIGSVTVYTSTDAITPRAQQTRARNYESLRKALSIPMPDHVGLCQDSCTEEQKHGTVYTFNVFGIDEIFTRSGTEEARKALLQAIEEAKRWVEDLGAVTVYYNYQAYQYKACRAEHSTFLGFCVHPELENVKLIEFYKGFGFDKKDKSKPNNCQEMFLSLEKANALLAG